jgi:hypothetical protein
MPKRVEHFRANDEKHFKRAINKPNLKASFKQFARVQVREVPRVGDFLENLLEWPRREIDALTLGEALPFLELHHGLNGDFKALADVLDRIHGKASQTVHNTVQGEVFHVVPPPAPKQVSNAPNEKALPVIDEGPGISWRNRNSANPKEAEETEEERNARFARYRKEEEHKNDYVEEVDWDE